MSSYIRIQKVCEECGQEFTARKTATRCCSDHCAKRSYKRRKRTALWESVQQETRRILVDKISNQPMQIKASVPRRELINEQTSDSERIKKELLSLVEMAFVIGVSKRTLQRLLGDKNFPRIQLRKRIVFQKTEVLNYLHQNK